MNEWLKSSRRPIEWPRMRRFADEIVDCGLQRPSELTQNQWRRFKSNPFSILDTAKEHVLIQTRQIVTAWLSLCRPLHRSLNWWNDRQDVEHQPIHSIAVVEPFAYQPHNSVVASSVEFGTCNRRIRVRSLKQPSNGFGLFQGP
jgi:hypothetical protein